MRKIAIICGGYSGEYEISIKSAKVVKSHLDSNIYDSYLIVIQKGEWYCLTDDEQHIPVDKNDFSININGNKITFDAVFNAVHGISHRFLKTSADTGYFLLTACVNVVCEKISD